MIVCVLSLGSCWREPNDGRPVVWNSSGVLDQRGIAAPGQGIRPRPIQ